MEFQQLPAADYNYQNYTIAPKGPMKDVRCNLQNIELWEQFNDITNEMIVTKGGRRMFPVIKADLKGLEEETFYSVFLEFIQIGDNRYKYINGQWHTGGKAEPCPPNPVYKHPSSPNYGKQWMKEAITFAKVKLTNKMCGDGHIMLNSLHMYEPRVVVVKVVPASDPAQKGAEDGISGFFGGKNVAKFPFPQTRFIAVTAYQNDDVTGLKIRYNPFAKAFQTQENAVSTTVAKERSQLDERMAHQLAQAKRVTRNTRVNATAHAAANEAAHAAAVVRPEPRFLPENGHWNARLFSQNANYNNHHQFNNANWNHYHHQYPNYQLAARPDNSPVSDHGSASPPTLVTHHHQPYYNHQYDHQYFDNHHHWPQHHHHQNHQFYNHHHNYAHNNTAIHPNLPTPPNELKVEQPLSSSNSVSNNNHHVLLPLTSSSSNASTPSNGQFSSSVENLAINSPSPTLQQNNYQISQLSQLSPLAQLAQQAQMAQQSPQMAQQSPQMAQISPQIVHTAPQIAQISPQMAQQSPQIVQISPQMAQIAPQIVQIAPQQSPPVQQVSSAQISPVIKQSTSVQHSPEMQQSQSTQHSPEMQQPQSPLNSQLIKDAQNDENFILGLESSMAEEDRQRSASLALEKIIAEAISDNDGFHL